MLFLRQICGKTCHISRCHKKSLPLFPSETAPQNLLQQIRRNHKIQTHTKQQDPKHQCQPKPQIFPVGRWFASPVKTVCAGRFPGRQRQIKEARHGDAYPQSQNSHRQKDSIHAERCRKAADGKGKKQTAYKAEQWQKHRADPRKTKKKCRQRITDIQDQRGKECIRKLPFFQRQKACKITIQLTKYQLRHLKSDPLSQKHTKEKTNSQKKQARQSNCRNRFLFLRIDQTPHLSRSYAQDRTVMMDG